MHSLIAELGMILILMTLMQMILIQITKKFDYFDFKKLTKIKITKDSLMEFNIYICQF